MKRLFSEVGDKAPIDFVMYLGDDEPSENAFTYLNHLSKKAKRLEHDTPVFVKNCHLITATIGHKVTSAKNFL